MARCTELSKASVARALSLASTTTVAAASSYRSYCGYW
jgi:hypothetical protein